MKIGGSVCRLCLPRRAPRNVAHESTVTRPQSAAIANVIPNFPGADFRGLTPEMCVTDRKQMGYASAFSEATPG